MQEVLRTEIRHRKQAQSELSDKLEELKVTMEALTASLLAKAAWFHHVPSGILTPIVQFFPSGALGLAGPTNTGRLDPSVYFGFGTKLM